MKAIKPLFPIISLVVFSQVSQARDWPQSVSHKTGDQWSLDGQVFQPFKQYPRVKSTGRYALLRLSPDGQLSTEWVNLEASDPPPENVQLLVDDVGPDIITTWDSVVADSTAIVIGPNSALNIQTSDGVLSTVQLDGQSVPQSDGVLNFTKPISHINLTATDAFNNITQWNQSVTSDFHAPIIHWQPLPPMVKIKQQWVGKSIADIKVSGTDQQALQWSLNAQSIDLPENGHLSVQPNDILTATDALGNSSQQTINWQTDNTPPQIVIKTAAGESTAERTIHLSVNELMQVYVRDEALQVTRQTYQGKSRHWKPLPKSFRFTSKGRYRIKVKASDEAGNSTEQTLNIKVKRSH